MTIHGNTFFGALGAAFVVLLAVTLIDAGSFTSPVQNQANIIDATKATEAPLASTSESVSVRSASSSTVLETPVRVEPDASTQSTAIITETSMDAPDAPRVLGLSLGERDTIIDLHNDARAAVGVSSLTWSVDLAESAESWAEVLQGRGCELEHSNNEQFGENLYYAKKSNGQVTVAEVVAAFTNEKAEYDPVTNTCTAGAECGHYTQVVWEDTTKIGCARAVCGGVGMREEVWVCEYGPRGNIRGERPYTLK